jgi:hypothetical protein
MLKVRDLNLLQKTLWEYVKANNYNALNELTLSISAEQINSLLIQKDPKHSNDSPLEYAANHKNWTMVAAILNLILQHTETAPLPNLLTAIEALETIYAKTYQTLSQAEQKTITSQRTSVANSLRMTGLSVTDQALQKQLQDIQKKLSSPIPAINQPKSEPAESEIPKNDNANFFQLAVNLLHPQVETANENNEGSIELQSMGKN